MPHGAPKKPLKVGIREDIFSRLRSQFDGRRLMRMLKWALPDYCGGPTYLRALTEGTDRVDLEGNPCGVVTKGEAEHALKRLSLLQEKWALQQQVAAE